MRHVRPGAPRTRVVTLVIGRRVPMQRGSRSAYVASVVFVVAHVDVDHRHLRYGAHVAVQDRPARPCQRVGDDPRTRVILTLRASGGLGFRAMLQPVCPAGGRPSGGLGCYRVPRRGARWTARRRPAWRGAPATGWVWTRKYRCRYSSSTAASRRDRPAPAGAGGCRTLHDPVDRAAGRRPARCARSGWPGRVLPLLRQRRSSVGWVRSTAVSSATVCLTESGSTAAQQPGGVFGVHPAGLEDHLQPDVLQRALSRSLACDQFWWAITTNSPYLRVSESIRVNASSDWAMNWENSSIIR